MAEQAHIRINPELYEAARREAELEKRSISEQIELWARLGRAVLDNPDLPAEFVAQSLASLAENRNGTTAFVPRTRQEYEQLLDRLEDLEDVLLVKERVHGPFIEVSLDDL